MAMASVPDGVTSSAKTGVARVAATPVTFAQKQRTIFPHRAWSLTDMPDNAEWTRVRLRAERLGWVASALAAWTLRLPSNIPPRCVNTYERTLADRLREYAPPD